MAARPPTRILAVANQKGGVGKTTTAVNLAASVAVAEKRTLLVDFDPQGNASSGVGIRPRTVIRSVYDALIGRAQLRDIIVQTELSHLSVAPATQDLAGAELELVDALDRATKLRALLAQLAVGKPRYDYIFIDCPPALGLLTINALVAADRVIVPLQCEYYALEGLTQLMATIDRVKGALNPKLDVDGIALTMFDPRNNLSHQVAEEVKKHFRVYESVIPRNVRLSEAPSHGKPALLYDAQSRGALLPASGSQGASGGPDRSVFLCPIERIVPQKGQPRQRFDEAALEGLAASIADHGLIEPVIVRRAPGPAERYEIIAGERRWRAAQRAGLTELQVVVKDVSSTEAFELALIENIQREDLNPIELAEAFDRLIREHAYTHETLAGLVKKDRSTITNALRLLRLPPRVRTMVIDGRLTEGHARSLLGATDESAIESVADKVVRGKLNVRQTEQLIRGGKAAQPKAGTSGAEGKPEKKSVSVRDLETKLGRRFGTKVEVRDHKGKGEIALFYSSLDELDRLLDLLR